MAELKCSVEQCVWNKERLCSKGDIQVGGKHANKMEETSCESYSPKKGDSYSSSISHPSQLIHIDCEAVKCVYNEDYKCAAPHVDIKGCSTCGCKDTLCATFTDR